MCSAKYDPNFFKDEIPVISSDKSTKSKFVAATFENKIIKKLQPPKKTCYV